MWGPLLEKAWAKIKGTYTHSDGGYVQTGLRSVTGVPVFWLYMPYYDDDDMDTIYSYIKEADDYDYLIGAGTSGGSDTTTNDCGIANGHAYSIVSAFSMTDSSSYSYNMLLMRNPLGVTYYSSDWSADDSRWTYDMID